LAAINKRKVLESAQKNLQKGAVDKALKDYQALLDADPRDANVRLKVGDLKLRLGKTDEAIAAYLKVADQFTRDGFDAKAVAIYKQVSKLDTKRFDVYIPLADLYQRLGLTSEAMVALQTAAEAYQRDGRKREALDLLRRMASLDASNTASRLKVAELLLQEGLASEALVELGEVAAELERQGDWEARVGVLQRVLELSPERVESYEALITLWLDRRQPKRAESLARKLVGIDAERAESHELLARVFAELGDEAGAIDAFRKAADAWIARGMEDRARSILQRHIPSEPFDFGGTTDPFDVGRVAAGPREGESPFGEEGIGGEPMALDDEFAFITDDAPAADAVAAPIPPVAKSPEPRVATRAKAVPPASPAPAPSTPIVSEARTTVLREAPAPERVAAPAEPVASVPTEASEAPEDVDQLLAEAGVYLRYGKRERAVASLETLLRSEPQHVAALELLGDAHAGAEATAPAVEAWTRAAQAAAALGDATRVASLRSRIEALDATAAAALSALAAPSIADAAATIDLEASALEEATPANQSEAIAGDSGSLDDIEIDVDVDVADFNEPVEGSVSDEAAASASSAVAVPAADAGAPSADAGEIEIELDADAFADVPAADAGGPIADESADFDVSTFDGADLDGSESEHAEIERPETPGVTAPFEELEVPDHFEVAEAPSEPACERLLEPLPIPLEQRAQPEPDAELDLADALELSEVIEVEPAPALQPEPAPSPAPEPEAPLALELESAAEAAAEPQPESQPAAVPAAEPAPSEFSSTTSAEITEDLEEAAFYFEQGLLDEAEAIYLRVVQRAPHHPSALLRLGEIAVARGQDAAQPVADVPKIEQEALDPGESSFEAVQEVEPPDDLDLTAREFGPTRTWADDETDDDVADTASASLPSGTLPLDDVTEESLPVEGEPGEGVESVAGVLDAASASDVTTAEEDPIPPPVESTPCSVTAPDPDPETLPEPELTIPEVSIAEDAGAPAFDLAAELSEALTDATPATRAGASTDQEGFSSLFSEFKRGVSRTLGEGDVETHFDLGIAYREMGLLDDAIGEFHYALGSAVRRLDALHMMGLCALDVGRASDAIGHLEQALASPDVPAERETALRFDLGRAQEAAGDRDRALDAFRRVAELDAEFQDVGARIEALLLGPAATDDGDTSEAEGDEVYESFDDLIAEAADEASPVAAAEPAVAESYENFDEFLSDDEDDEAVSADPLDDESDTEESVEIESGAAVAVVTDVEASIESDVPEPPAAEPEPPPGPTRRRKVSFF
jgi:pilus assembly protein FimV